MKGLRLEAAVLAACLSAMASCCLGPGPKPPKPPEVPAFLQAWVPEGALVLSASWDPGWTMDSHSTLVLVRHGLTPSPSSDPWVPWFKAKARELGLTLTEEKKLQDGSASCLRFEYKGPRAGSDSVVVHFARDTAEEFVIVSKRASYD